MLDKIIDTAGFNAVVKGRNGYTVFNKKDKYIGQAVERYGEYSELEMMMFRRYCKKDDYIVEVGANIGTHTQALAQLVGPGGRVIAFEPQRIVFQTLCANMAINSLTNVECYQKGVAAETGKLKIPEFDYSKENNYGGVRIDSFNRGYEVDIVTLDGFIDIPRLALLKIDAEGMEIPVIKGASETINTHHPVLYVENDRKESSRALIELIQSFNYRLFWHFAPLFNPDNLAADQENIYPGLVSKNMVCLPKENSNIPEDLSEILDSNETRPT